MDVPAVADIQLDLSAGELSFKGVEGNKSVSMWAGEVTMEVGDPQLYRRVDVTVRAGEIQASPFGGSRGGLMRSFRWNGEGRVLDHCEALCWRGETGQVITPNFKLQTPKECSIESSRLNLDELDVEDEHALRRA